MNPEQQADAHSMEPGVPATAFPQAGDKYLTKEICNHTISLQE